MNRNVANFLALSECGRFQLYVHYMTRLTKYWLKLSMLTENRYPKQCYKMLKCFDDSGRNTWATDVKTWCTNIASLACSRSREYRIVFISSEN